jgi:hypothetical protein
LDARLAESCCGVPADAITMLITSKLAIF